MNKILLFLLVSLSAQIAMAQDISLGDHLTKLSKDQSSFLKKKDMQVFYQQADVNTVLKTYLQSDKKNVQREAVRIATNIGANHQSENVRQNAVKQLLDIAPTASTSIAGRIAKGLQKVNQKDFTSATVQQVALMAKKEQAHQDRWIELAGFLQLQEVLSELAPMYKDNKKLYQKISLALTRCGDEQKKENLLQNVQKIKVNDEFIFGVMPLLVYTRQKETTDYLFDIILSNDKACTPVGPDIKGNIECGYRVMEAIAPYIEGIPLEVSASGDLTTTDYKKALADTRAWINANRSNYTLKTDIF